MGNAYVVSVDDFIVKDRLGEPSWDGGMFDRDRLEDQVLAPICEGRRAAYQKLVWADDSLSDQIEIPAVDYLIVEGITSYHPSIRDHYDYTIWVDVPLELAKRRGRARDGSSANAAYWDRWADNDLRYLEQYHPEHVADFIVDNREERSTFEVERVTGIEPA